MGFGPLLEVRVLLAQLVLDVICALGVDHCFHGGFLGLVVDSIHIYWVGVIMVQKSAPCNYFFAEIRMIDVRLKEERERLSMSQTAFAEAAGAAKRTLIDWEKGVSSPTAVQLSALSKIGVDVLYVLTGARQGAGLGESAVHQAVLDAVDLLSLESKVDSSQLAKAVVKLCARHVSNSSLSQTGSNTQIASAGGVNVGGANSGVINTGSHTVQQNFHKEVKGDVVGRDKIVQPSSSTRDKTRNEKR